MNQDMREDPLLGSGTSLPGETTSAPLCDEETKNNNSVISKSSPYMDSLLDHSYGYGETTDFSLSPSLPLKEGTFEHAYVRNGKDSTKIVVSSSSEGFGVKEHEESPVKDGGGDEAMDEEDVLLLSPQGEDKGDDNGGDIESTGEDELLEEKEKENDMETGEREDEVDGEGKVVHKDTEKKIDGEEMEIQNSETSGTENDKDSVSEMEKEHADEREEVGEAELRKKESDNSDTDTDTEVESGDKEQTEENKENMEKTEESGPVGKSGELEQRSVDGNKEMTNGTETMTDKEENEELTKGTTSMVDEEGDSESPNASMDGFSSSRGRRRSKSKIALLSEENLADLSLQQELGERMRLSLTPSESCRRRKIPRTKNPSGIISDLSATKFFGTPKIFTPEQLEDLAQPFKYGWKREIVIRGIYEEVSFSGKPKKIPADVYYFPPKGNKIRSMPDILKNLAQFPGTPLGEANFTFSRRTIYHPPKEVVRHANPGRGPHSKEGRIRPEVVIERDDDEGEIQDQEPLPEMPPLVKSPKKRGRPPKVKKLIISYGKQSIVNSGLPDNIQVKTCSDDNKEASSFDTPEKPKEMLLPTVLKFDVDDMKSDKKVEFDLPTGDKAEKAFPSNETVIFSPPKKKFKATARKSTTMKPRTKPRFSPEIENLCSLACPGLGGIPPALFCSVCMCLFHPECVNFRETPGAVFTCLRCKSATPKEDEMSFNLANGSPATLPEFTSGLMTVPVPTTLKTSVPGSLPGTGGAVTVTLQDGVHIKQEPIDPDDMAVMTAELNRGNLNVLSQNQKNVSDITMGTLKHMLDKKTGSPGLVNGTAIPHVQTPPHARIIMSKSSTSVTTSNPGILSFRNTVTGPMGNLAIPSVKTGSMSAAPMSMSSALPNFAAISGLSSARLVGTGGTSPSILSQQLAAGPGVSMFRTPLALSSNLLIPRIPPPMSSSPIIPTSPIQNPLIPSSVIPHAKPGTKIIAIATPPPTSPAASPASLVSTAKSAGQSQMLTLPPAVVKRLSLNKPLSLKVNNVQIVVPPASLVQGPDGLKVFLPPNTFPVNSGNYCVTVTNDKGASVTTVQGGSSVSSTSSSSSTSSKSPAVSSIQSLLSSSSTTSSTSTTTITVSSTSSSQTSMSATTTTSVMSSTTNTLKSSTPVAEQTRRKTRQWKSGIDHSACVIKKLYGGFDCMLQIFHYLNVRDLLRVGMVCKTWRQISQHPSLWRRVHFQGVNVSDWTKALKYLWKQRVEAVNFVGLDHDDPNKTWHQLFGALQDMNFLKEIRFGMVPPSILHSLCEKLLDLEVLIAESISEHFIQIQESHLFSSDAPAKLDIGKFATLHNLRELKLRGGVGGITLPSFSFNGALGELGMLKDLQVLNLTSLKNISASDFSFLSKMTQLTELKIGDCTSWTAETYALLGEMTCLKCLRLEFGGEDPDIWLGPALCKLHGLERLELYMYVLCVDLKDYLKSLTKLETLIVWPDTRSCAAMRNHCTMLVVKELKQLKNLDWVILSSSSSSIVLDGDTNGADNQSNMQWIPFCSDEGENIQYLYINIYQLTEQLTDFLPETRIKVYSTQPGSSHVH